MSATSSKTIPPPIFYLDVNLATLETGLQPISKFVNRNSPIVDCPSDYYISVARFICSTQRIPLWQPQLNTTSPNNDGIKTIYSITLSYSTSISTQVYMQVINEDNTVPAPTAPVLTEPLTTWGNVYSYFTICDMINTALATAYTDLVAKVAVSGVGLYADPPYMTWNPTTQLFSMTGYPLSQYDQSTGGDVVNIYFNNNFRQFLLGWDYQIQNNSTSSSTGQDVLLVMQNLENNISPTPAPPTAIDPTTTTLIMSQHISSPFCFIALSRIQVLASLPLAFPYLTDNPLAIAQTGLNNNTENILLDFIVNYADGGASAYQQPILYSASSDLFTAPQKLSGSHSINSFFTSVRWVNLQGYSVPLETFGLRNASIKFAFIHKSIIERF
jgi:hypothetical protein